MKNLTKKLCVFGIALFMGHASIAQNSLLFDGIDDYVEVPPFALNNLNPDEFTFEAWVEGTESATSPHPMIFSNRQQTGPSTWIGVSFFFHNFWSGSLHKMLAVQLDGINYMIYNNGTAGKILDGNCHHVAVAREGNILIFMVDGVDIGTRTIAGSPTTNSGNPMWIGRDLVVPNTSFTGRLSDVRIWDRTRNWPEVQAEMAMPIPMGYPNLLGLWDFAAGGGQTTFDQSGFGFDGTLGSTFASDVNDPLWDNMPCHPYRGPGSLSIEETTETEALLYPNPVVSNLTIELAESLDEKELQIFNSLGQLMHTESISNKSLIQINVNDLSPGIYFMHIMDNSGYKTVKKFTKE